jgi:antitoxin (DNA-binding transcriptional repressor) of toxin-antitoxin stability system
MKRITASEARRNWFEVLDRVAAGEVLMIERHGRWIVLRREEAPAGSVQDYSALIRAVDDVSRADEWTWDWTEEGELRPGGDGRE